jgi:hypothetical protein
MPGLPRERRDDEIAAASLLVRQPRPRRGGNERGGFGNYVPLGQAALGARSCVRQKLSHPSATKIADLADVNWEDYNFFLLGERSCIYETLAHGR